MKKFWNFMLVALVMLGAAACTESDPSIEKENSEAVGLSFYAEIVNDATRAELEYDEESQLWNTVWEANDTIVAVHYDSEGSLLGEYEFTNSAEEPNKFTCTKEGVESILGDWVVFDYTPSYYSELGKKGICAMATAFEFDIAESVKLEAHNSFLRYTYNGSGSVTISLEGKDGNSTPEFHTQENDYTTSITRTQTGENWVSVLNFGGVEDVIISYSIDGVKCKETTISYNDGKIYNLGTLELPYEISDYSVPGTHNEWTAGKTPMYIVGDYYAAFNVTFAEDGMFKVLGPNDKWIGANNLTVGKWTAASTDAGDIAISAGAYDIYYSDAESKICVVAAGESVPAMPQFSLGVIGLGGNWDVDKDMTLEGGYYTLKGVAIAATDSFKLRVSDDWAENYGISSTTTAESVAIQKDTMYSLVQDGKNMQVEAGSYDLYFNYATKEFYALTPGTTPDDLAIAQYKIYVHPYNNVWTKFNLYSWDSAGANPTGAWPGSTTTVTESINGYTYYVWTMPRSATGTSLSIILNDGSSQTADFVLGTLDKDYYLLLNGISLSFVEDKENPEPEVVQGEPQPSTWALAGDFNSWGDEVMYTTDQDNLFVAKSVTIGAYKEIKVKQVGNWNTSYGGGINYLNANIWTKAYSGGSNFSIINAGTYDIYFDNANKRIYVMTEGTDYSTATEQSANGAAPDLSSASWGLCGAHNNWGSPDTKLEWDGTIGFYVALNAKLTGEFKVRANNSWGEDYGCGGTITVNAAAGKAMSRGGGNCKVSSGTYDVYFDLSTKKIWVRTPGSDAPTK